MDNMAIYQRFRAVPQEAQKTITGGRLNGMTDINPMWRIKCLTEQFGPSGIGWAVDNVIYSTERMESGETAAFCTLDLRIKTEEGWSQAIHGTGGSMLVAKEKSGLRLDDEAYKKAYTDAMSVACKALGIGADIYWSKDATKYTSPQAAAQPAVTCERCSRQITDTTKLDGSNWPVSDIVAYSRGRFGGTYCPDCMKALQKAQKEREHGGGN